MGLHGPASITQRKAQRGPCSLSEQPGLPRDAGPYGYHLSLRGQLQVFQDINNVVGILACRRLLIDLAGDLEKPYSNLMAALKQQIPDADYSTMEHDLTEDADAVRQAVVREVLGDGEDGTSGG